MEENEDGLFEQKRDMITAIWLGEKFIALGVPTGYKIFSLNPIKLIKDKDLGGGIGMIGFYNSDKIIWFVGGGDCPAAPENELRLWDNHHDEQLCKIVQKTNIKGVSIKPEQLFISLVDKVYLYTLPLSDKITSFNTVDNPYGVLAMAKGQDASIVAFLDPEKNGALVVYDYDKEAIKCNISGDSTTEFFITWLTLNESGSILATATSEGCTIHLYSTMDGSKLRDFTRGSVPTNINFLSFQLDDSRLLVSSDSGTIHIFMVDWDIDSKSKYYQPKNSISRFSFLGGLIPYLGKIGSYWKFYTPELMTVSMMPTEGSLIVLALTGKVYFATINVDEGGEALLENTSNLKYRTLVEEDAQTLAR